MKATIRADAAAMVPESHKGDRFDYFCRQNAGKRLEVLNVTSSDITLKLPNVQWAIAGSGIAFGIDRISLPKDDWVDEKITWSAWDADRKAAKEATV
jgi:hypothetical protein